MPEGMSTATTRLPRARSPLMRPAKPKASPERARGKAGAKERVHPHVRAPAAVHANLAHAGLAGAAQVFDGVRAPGLAAEGESRLAARRFVEARRRQAITAVAAGAAGEEDGLACAKALDEHVRQGLRRALHEADGGNAFLVHVALLHRAHLRGGEQHVGTLLAGVGTCRPVLLHVSFWLSHIHTSHISIQAAHGDVAGQHGLYFAIHLPEERAVFTEAQRFPLAAFDAYALPQRRRKGADASSMGARPSRCQRAYHGSKRSRKTGRSSPGATRAPVWR